jgi:ribosomal protein L15
VIRGTEQGLHEISGQGDAGSGRSYTYPVDEKMRPMITSMGRHEADTFTLARNPQTRKISRWNEWEYTKIRDRKNEWDTIELVRKNVKGEIESVYRDLKGGVDITQRNKIKHSEYRFTSGPAAGKVRRVSHEVDGKVTHFEKYAYDEKGRPIRGQENDNRFRFEYDDKLRTAASWRNDKLVWKKSMDVKNRIVKVEYPDGKELHLAYPEKRPMTAELVWNNASIVAQRNSDGSVKEGTAIIRATPE